MDGFLPMLQKEMADARQDALEREEKEPETVITSPGRKAKSARAYAKTYNLGPPLVPKLIVERIVTYIHKVAIRKTCLILTATRKPLRLPDIETD